MDNKKYELTKQGLEKIKNELNDLINQKRPEVIERIKEARSFGDLSENSEYDAAKDEQGRIESRIKEIQHIIENVEIIKINDSETKSSDLRQVRIGRTVDVLDLESKKINTYTIVGTLESDPGKGYISNESPLATAILYKKEGDEVIFETPQGLKKTKIVKIHTVD